MIFSLSVTACLTNVGLATLIAATAVPLVRRKVKMNMLYGVRFARSYESDELWYRINEYGGRRLIQWSGVVAACGVAALLVSDRLWASVLMFAPFLYLVPCVDSYLYSRRA